MTNHTKPTNEELEADINRALEDLDKKEEPKTEVEETTEEPKEEPTEEVVEDKEEPKDEPKKEEDKTDPDYKEKFVASTKEAYILHAKNKKLVSAVDEAAKINDISEEELTKEYPEWDMMDDTEKNIAKKALINEKRFAFIHEAAQAGKDIEAWHDKVTEYVGDPKTLVDYPDLEGKTEEFEKFAMKETRRGIDFETLTASFLYKEGQTVKQNKGKMFETGNGGSKGSKPKSDKLTLAEAAVLQKTNYKKYKEYLMADKIED